MKLAPNLFSNHGVDNYQSNVSLQMLLLHCSNLFSLLYLLLCLIVLHSATFRLLTSVIRRGDAFLHIRPPSCSCARHAASRPGAAIRAAILHRNPPDAPPTVVVRGLGRSDPSGHAPEPRQNPQLQPGCRFPEQGFEGIPVWPFRVSKKLFRKRSTSGVHSGRASKQ